MSLALSIRNKLLLSVIIAVIGFVILGSVAFKVLTELKTSSEGVKSARDTAEVVTDVHTHILSLTLHKGSLTNEEKDTFASHVGALSKDQGGTLVEIASRTDGQQLKGLLEQLKNVLDKYTHNLNQWLEIKAEHGFNGQSGNLGELNTAADKLVEVVAGFSAFARKISNLRGIEKEFLLNGNPKIAGQFKTQVEKLATSATEMGFEDFVPQISAYGKSFEKVKTSFQSLKVIEDSLKADIGVVETTTKSTSEFLHNEVLPKVYASAESADSNAKVTLFSTAIVVALFLAGLLTWISKSITSGISDTSAFMGHIADGELTYRMTGYEQSTDEFGVLAATANKMAENLGELVNQSNGISQELEGMSDGLSSATKVLVDGNSQIAGQTTQVATAAEQMNATVEEVARSTSTLHESAERATEAGATSMEVISRTDETIKKITETVNDAAVIIDSLSESSSRIGLVVDVIDTLAEQTNLLALNAAIEAARAGDAGRGFAVVADEVRNLASKTTEATSQITEIVTSIQNESQNAVKAMDRGQSVAQQGVELGEQALESINLIEQQTTITSEQSGQMATAVEEMSATIREMSMNIESVANEVKRNESAALDISSTANQVASKASELQRHAGQFQV